MPPKHGYRGTPEERFMERVMPEPNSGCWLWVGAVNDCGYGFLRIADRMVRAHRFSYMLHKGPIPTGLDVDHTCSVRCCVNPAHLEAVTSAENTRRAWVRGRCQNVGIVPRQKTHCPHGHPYSGDNLRVRLDDGSRVCRTCESVRAKRRRAHERMKEAA